MNGYLSKERMLNMLVDSPEAEIKPLSEEQERRRFKITSFVQAVAMLSQPLSVKALEIAAGRLSITPHGLITLLSVYSTAATPQTI